MKDETESRKENMLPGTRTVAVTRLPEQFDLDNSRQCIREIRLCMNVSRPCLVLDCSGLRQVNRQAIYFLLCCLEEAMKRNGDVRLAEVSADAKAMLGSAGAARLFQVFDSISEAIDSYVPHTMQRDGVDNTHRGIDHSVNAA